VRERHIGDTEENVVHKLKVINTLK